MNSIGKLIILGALIITSGCATHRTYQSGEYYPVYPQSDTRVYSGYYSAPAYRAYYEPPVRVIERRPVTVINKRVEVIKPAPVWRGKPDRHDYRRYERDKFNRDRDHDHERGGRDGHRADRRDGSGNDAPKPHSNREARYERPSSNQANKGRKRQEWGSGQIVARNDGQSNQNIARQRERTKDRQARQENGERGGGR